MIGTVRQARDERKGERGIALLVVIFVVATLSILVLEFMHSTRIHLYIAGNIADGMKAFYLAKSGVSVAAGAMLEDAQDNKEDHLHEDWAQALPAIPGGEGWVTVEITDESSKLNVNQLVRKSGLPDAIKQEVFTRILTEMELDPELANAVIDWIDKDDEGQNGGQENSIYGYAVTTDSYGSKNATFLSLNELTLVNGMTDEIFKKLAPYITIYGGKKLNLNTVNEKVLKTYVQVLSRDDDTKPAEEIISWRDGEDENYFKDKKVKRQLVNDIGLDTELAAKLAKHFGGSSEFYSVESQAMVGESTKSCLGVFRRTKKNVKIIYFRPI